MGLDKLKKLDVRGNNLNDEDVSRLLAIAGADRSKTLVQHAEEFSKKKIGDRASLRAEIAKEFGIDVTKFDANKLREQEAEGDIGALFKGKRFSFKKDKDSLSPKEAMVEYFKRKG